MRIYEDYVSLSYGNKAGGSRDVLFKKNTRCTCISYQFCQFFFFKVTPKFLCVTPNETLQANPCL